MIGKMKKRYTLLVGLVLVLGMVLAGCGGGEATPTAAVLATETPAAAAPTDTTAPVMTETTAPAADTPTAAAVVSPTVASGGVVSANATPVSDWKPGAYPNTVKAPAKLVSGGTLTVGSDTTYPPQEYIDSTGKAVGMDVDIADEIATRMGLQLKVVTFKFDDIIPALNAGQFDIVISAMTITPDRSKVVDFVPYFEAGQAVLVPKGNPKAIKTLDDLSGKTVAVQSGTVEEQTLKDQNDKFTKAGKPKANVLTYTADTDAVDQVRVGRADASMHDSPVAAYYAKISSGAFEVAVTGIDSAPEGIVVAKNNPDMLKAIQSTVNAMKSDGTLDKIKAKWGVQ